MGTELESEVCFGAALRRWDGWPKLERIARDCVLDQMLKLEMREI
jgi:hypothetical protein